MAAIHAMAARSCAAISRSRSAPWLARAMTGRVRAVCGRKHVTHRAPGSGQGLNDTVVTALPGAYQQRQAYVHRASAGMGISLRKSACCCGRHLQRGDEQQQGGHAGRRRPGRHPQHHRQGGAGADGGDVQRRGHQPASVAKRPLSAHSEGSRTPRHAHDGVNTDGVDR